MKPDKWFEQFRGWHRLRVGSLRSLKYFITLGVSFAILAYLGNSIFVSEKERVIQQHLVQAQLVAHLGATSMAYAIDKIGDGQKIIASFLEHKSKWRARDIRPLLQSFVKANHKIIRWAGLSEVNGRILVRYPRHGPLPIDLPRVLARFHATEGKSRAIKIKVFYQRRLFLMIRPVSQGKTSRYVFWCIGSFEAFLRTFISEHQELESRYLWLVFVEGHRQVALYMDAKAHRRVVPTTFPLPFSRKELTYDGRTLLVGAHAIRFGEHQGWFVVGIPRNRIEGQLSEFRNQGMLLTGFFVIFFAIFLYTYFKNRSRRIVAERTANISREILISKQQLESYIENSSDAILRNDLDGRIQFVNPAFTRIFGWAASEVVGKNILDVFPEDKTRIAKVVETIKAKKAVPPYETRRRRKDGQMLDLYVSASPILNSQGEVIAITAVYRDHTGLKRLEDRLYQSEKMAAIGQLVAQIAHEINNPLSTLQFSLQLLKRSGPNDPDFMEEIQDMDEEIRRIARIVDQLLSFSRPQSKRKRQTSLKRVLRNKVLQLLFKNLRERGVNVEIDLPDGLPLVRVYSDQMLQVFMNLTQNASDSIEKKGTITIRARRRVLDYDTFYQLSSRSERLGTPTGEVVEIVVSDTGRGIPPENLPHIFEPFFTSKGPKGTGLGLSIVHGIVSRAGGSIEVESTPGRGTTFTLILPAVETRVKRDKAGRNVVQKEAESGGRHKK